MNTIATRALVWERDGGVAAGAWLGPHRRYESRFMGNRTRFECAVGIVALAMNENRDGDTIVTDCPEAAEWWTSLLAGEVEGHEELPDTLVAYCRGVVEFRGRCKVQSVGAEEPYSARMQAAWFLANQALREHAAPEIDRSVRLAQMKRSAKL